jgi:hypothetical protein
VLRTGTWLPQIMTPLIGLTLGKVLQPVPADHRARTWWWPVGHAVAVAGGWLLALGLGLPPGRAPALILASVWYGAVSGLLMLAVLRGHPATEASTFLGPD